MGERFKPSRAGVINLWDYVDEEWAFADGRLALRGHNGSGKTEALEVLFPFVLDGVADSRRLDPFSGENRTMKSNLLYRGQESEYGYVWMEFCRVAPPMAKTAIASGAQPGLPPGGPTPGTPSCARPMAGTAEENSPDPRPESDPYPETVTLIIGMRAHRNSDGVRMSFFVTGKRLGVDFGLLSADSRPLTERQLRSVLEPDAWRRTATEYRDLVDHRLFGLGRERYAQLLDLLLALRRPLLAKDLDPVKVSDTLTAGLSPVDEDLVQQAARDFENLAAVQKLFDDLMSANAGVAEFRAHYEAYLRSHVRFALDRVQARSDAAADHAERLTAAAVARRRAAAAERGAEADRDASRAEGERAAGRLDGLRNSEEYKAQGRIEDKRREVAARAADVARQRAGVDSGRRRVAGLADEVTKLSRRAAGSRAAAARHAAALADAAQRSGIADDGFGPVDPGTAGDHAAAGDAGGELLTIARARVAARRDDIGEIRRLLDAIRDARAKRAYADKELARKQAVEQRQQSAAESAAARLTEARRAAAESLSAWTDRWGSHAVAATDAATLAAALDRIGEPGAASLSEIYDGCVSDRQAATIAVRTSLESALTECRRSLADLREERDAIAAERDDAPPSSDQRPASREQRRGAPLWRLVRFAPDVPDETAAAIEGALYGAGLLTAWVHPDPALTAAALQSAEADGYLIPTVPVDGTQVTARKTGKTLADVLVAENQEHVPSDVVVAVLRSISLADDIMTGGSDIPARPVALGQPRYPVQPRDPNQPRARRALRPSLDSAFAFTKADQGQPRDQRPLRGLDYVFGDAPALAPASPPRAATASTGPLISTRAQFSYGVHVGARPKARPEYIGATNRAARRRARLDDQDLRIARAQAQARDTEISRDNAQALLEDFRRARRELPDTAAIARQAEQAGTCAALLGHARTEVVGAERQVDEAIAEADAAVRQLRHKAAERRMPTGEGEVDAVARAAAEFENAAVALHGERRTLARAEEDLDERTESLARQRAEHEEAEAAAAAAERLQAAMEEEFRALEEALQQDVQQVLAQIRETERELAVAQSRYHDHDTRARREHDNVTAADRDVSNEREALAESIDNLYQQAGQFGEFTRADLRPLVGVAVATRWPEPAAWPTRESASADLADRLTGPDDTPLDPVTEVKRTLPEGAVELIDAFAQATRGGRQVTEGTLKNTQDRMSVALKDFTDALAACEEDYRVDWEPGAVVTVHVIDDEGRKPVSVFARRIDERAKDQGILLEDRERKVLEDELLAALASQIHTRVVAARDLTRNMNADTRAKPMSSGISIGIRWSQSDKITDAQRAASRLLDRDQPGPERLAELRAVLRDMIREYRAAHPRATYREALGAVIDYRSWHAFELVLITPGEGEQRLTRAKHSVMSGGEKSAAIHLPLFAAANALYSSAKDRCPRLIALDEAFVGIDERYKPDLFGLAVKFDLDLFMTGHDLWVTTATVPMIAHYDLYHDKVTRTTSALLLLWDGRQLIDATLGFKDNEALTTELLGFRPTRHTPLGTDATLYVPALEPDPTDPEDDQD